MARDANEYNELLLKNKGWGTPDEGDDEFLSATPAFTVSTSPHEVPAMTMLKMMPICEDHTIAA